MHPRDHEGRRGDVAAHAEPLADPLRQRRLAGAEVAGQDHQVAVARARVASHSPNARVSSAVRSTRVIGSILQHVQAVAVAAGLDVPELAPERRPSSAAPRAPRARARRTAAPSAISSARRRHLRGDAEPAHRGEYADPAQPEQPPARLEEQCPDRLALVLDEQPAVGVERLARSTRGSRRARWPVGRAAAGWRTPRGSPRARRRRASRRRSVTSVMTRPTPPGPRGPR